MHELVDCSMKKGAKQTRNGNIAQWNGEKLDWLLVKDIDVVNV